MSQREARGGDDKRSDIDTVARALARSWTDRTAPRPAPPELSVADGYAVQAAVIAELESPVVGYRIVASSARARERLGTDEPIIGVVTERNLTERGVPLETPPRVVEAEFAVQVDLQIDEPEQPTQIRAWHLSLDLPRSRITNEWSTLSAGQLVADTCLLGDVVVGPGTDATTAREMETAGSLTVTADGVAEHHPLPAQVPDVTARHLALVKKAVISGLVPPPETDTPFVQLGTEAPIRPGSTPTAISLSHPTLGVLELDLSTTSHPTGDSE